MRWVLAILMCAFVLSFSSCVPFGGDTEDYYETYDDFKTKWVTLAEYLPESSTNIRHYAVLDFDTNYHFVETTVKIDSLTDFAASNNDFDTQENYSEVSYSDQQFDRLFYARPEWWNREALSAYEKNYLGIFPDDDNYGKGIWIFHNQESGKLRLFQWMQQWCSVEDVKKGFEL